MHSWGRWKWPSLLGPMDQAVRRVRRVQSALFSPFAVIRGIPPFHSSKSLKNPTCTGYMLLYSSFLLFLLVAMASNQIASCQ